MPNAEAARICFRNSAACAGLGGVVGVVTGTALMALPRSVWTWVSEVTAASTRVCASEMFTFTCAPAALEAFSGKTTSTGASRRGRVGS